MTKAYPVYVDGEVVGIATQDPDNPEQVVVKIDPASDLSNYMTSAVFPMDLSVYFEDSADGTITGTGYLERKEQ